MRASRRGKLNSKATVRSNSNILTDSQKHPIVALNSSSWPNFSLFKFYFQFLLVIFLHVYRQAEVGVRHGWLSFFPFLCNNNLHSLYTFCYRAVGVRWCFWLNFKFSKLQAFRHKVKERDRVQFMKARHRWAWLSVANFLTTAMHQQAIITSFFLPLSGARQPHDLINKTSGKPHRNEKSVTSKSCDRRFAYCSRE